MPVTTSNTNSKPMPQVGSALQTGNYNIGPYGSTYYGGYFTQNPIGHTIAKINTLNQVVGLVPVYPCNSIECRLGKYGSDDSQFMLPAFAENQTSVWGDYKNDYNSWLFDVPANTILGLSYYLDQKINNVWTEKATLTDDTYGFYFPIGKLCNNNSYTGYQINWNKVLNLLGEGIYRFRIGTNNETITPSVNHFKITSVGGNPPTTVQLSSTGYGVICPTFYCNSSLSVTVNMQNLTTFINNYQNTTYPSPLFSATYNSGTGQIDLAGLKGQNCDCSVLVTNVVYTNYANAFSGGAINTSNSLCFASPPFCLKTWDCWAVDGTTRFDAFYSGGIIGNVDKSLPGSTWSMCCTTYKVTPNVAKSSMFAIRWLKDIVTYQATTTFSMTFTFSAPVKLLGAPYVVNSGDNHITLMQNLATAINNYQATLPYVQFTAIYNATQQRTEIYNLAGINVAFTVTYSIKKSICLGMNGFMPSYHADNTSADLGTLELPATTLPKTSFRDTVLLSGGTPAGFTTTGSLTPSPILWQDAIRVGGEFGYEQTDYERKSIKYQTGVVNKIRDEAILKHTWKSSSLPFWFHERFKVYGLMADKLLVSDSNMNNSDYNLKLYSVQGDSSYNPEYKNFPRETMVKCEFKPATQNIKRRRCC